MAESPRSADPLIATRPVRAIRGGTGGEPVGRSWIPVDACTLPTAQQPLRQSEFQELLADAVQQVERVSVTHLRLRLAAAANAAARELAAKESECCSFFTFRFAPNGSGSVWMDIEVPSGRIEVLDGLAALAAKHMTSLRTGQVADAAGVNIQTLRYYERRGLLAEPDRSPGGHRLYPQQTVTVLRVIKAAQRLGFTLDEVANLLEATQLGQRRANAGLQARAGAKLAEVDAKLAELTVVRDTLRAALAAGCDDLMECSESPSCPVPFASASSE